MSSDQKINILLVDDRPENLLALEAIIEQNDYHLVKALSGEEALKCLLKYDFAAILLDVQMPGIDGFGTAKIIKAREKTKHIPILFITANYLDSDHIFTGYAVGAMDYILKPFDPLILKAKVEGFVEIYKMNQKLIQQARILAEKTRELENANAELSKVTTELRLSEALANVIRETSMDSMIITDKEGVILKANPAIVNMFGYVEESILGQNIGLLFAHEESSAYIQGAPLYSNGLENIMSYDHSKEFFAVRQDGTLFPAEVQIGKRYVQGEFIVAYTIRDLTKKKQYEETIKHMAYHDSLTHLPNRRRFNDQLALKLTYARETNHTLALMYLDMDRFKYINDSLGHTVGDRVLQEVAGRLTGCMRAEDLVARVGGDEFNIILPDTNRERALEIAEYVINAFKQPFFIDSYELFVTVSLGISVFPYDGEDSLMLMKNADAALYRAKELGKNNYKVFHSGMNIQTYRSFIIQNDLRKAIEREELSLVYQPRIELESGAITSAEALLRWNHPSWGILNPLEFIPLAEETGQIVEIGEWVLRTACRQSKAWQDAGYSPIRIAVNFSAQQFLQKDLMAMIHRILQETNLNPDMLEIEITESIILGNEEIIAKQLHQIKNLGIKISMDDFGTGYCSLNYLRKFPVHTLKIDKSFIDDLSIPSSDTTVLVSTIISLAECLNMSVIAEGVETEEQLNILREYRCQEIQGYLFSPPIGHKEFEAFLSKSQPRETVNHGKITYITKRQRETVGEESNPLAQNETNIVQNEEILNIALDRTKQLYSISAREMDVFRLIVNGLSNKEISDQLFISEHTVKNHITRIFQKLTVNDRLQAMAKVYQACIEEGKNLRAL